MNTNLFVGGISYSTTEESLNQHFSQAGTVISAKIIIDRFTNRSRGFGFVEMSTPEEAQKAIEMFNDKELEGRILRVNEARPREDRPAPAPAAAPAAPAEPADEQPEDDQAADDQPADDETVEE